MIIPHLSSTLEPGSTGIDSVTADKGIPSSNSTAGAHLPMTVPMFNLAEVSCVAHTEVGHES